MRLLSLLLLLSLPLLPAAAEASLPPPGVDAAAPEPVRAAIVRAILAEGRARRAIIDTLQGRGEPELRELLGAWRQDALFVYAAPEGPVPVQRIGSGGSAAYLRVDTGQPLLGTGGGPLLPARERLRPVDHDGALRRAMKGVLDYLDLASPDRRLRLEAVQALGRAQALDKLPWLLRRQTEEADPAVREALQHAIPLTRLKSPDGSVRLAALIELKELHPLAGRDALAAALKEAQGAGRGDEAAAARAALAAVDYHRSVVNLVGTLFRGLSSGSVLLVVALGLAITFGLMGVINMAHGEMIAIGAYTTYVVQNLFAGGLELSPFGISLRIPGLGATGGAFDVYFIFALPLSFLSAALVGLALERGVIRFLYRRPLESLLATWGVSLILQQGLRLVFGANNVQVSSPAFLGGNWTVWDVMLGWNRLFVIGSAALIVLGVWLALTRTPLGLLIRAVMQNRSMASCLGVRTDRVNLFTFALGSGLAGLAGAFISQLANVGPSLGQNYIIDSFMTVVVGGVGQLAGTVVSAAGIGLLDQSLQQILLNPVLGKILVLGGIIIFLQWRPAGLFATRSRSLD